jgi:hypothetical protein
MTIKLTEEIRTQGSIARSARTIEEALRLIEEDLPVELRNLRHWTFARALLLQAQRTGAKKDMRNAVLQLKQALTREKWLIDSPPAGWELATGPSTARVTSGMRRCTRVIQARHRLWF